VEWQTKAKSCCRRAPSPRACPRRASPPLVRPRCWQTGKQAPRAPPHINKLGRSLVAGSTGLHTTERMGIRTNQIDCLVVVSWVPHADISAATVRRVRTPVGKHFRYIIACFYSNYYSFVQIVGRLTFLIKFNHSFHSKKCANYYIFSLL
jgi:hypothetical protein